MSIPESQLETWSNNGALTTAAATGRAIRDALNAPESLVFSINKAIYLQGSYKNTTNIRGDSDVDVVVQLRASFGYDVSTLNNSERASFDREYSNAIYTLDQFRVDVLSTMQRSFGDRVRSGNKAIFVAERPGFVDADVVPCQTYKHYVGSPAGTSVPYAMEGMQFFTQQDRRRIINWPRKHYDEGVAKNASTKGRYKPTVRIFKNFRNRLYDKGVIPTDSVPSYFLEGLIFNVPDANFSASSHALSAVNAMIWLQKEFAEGRCSRFVCGNGFIPLFGASSEQWDTASANKFVSACMAAWNAW